MMGRSQKSQLYRLKLAMLKKWLNYQRNGGRPSCAGCDASLISLDFLNMWLISTRCMGDFLSQDIRCNFHRQPRCLCHTCCESTKWSPQPTRHWHRCIRKHLDRHSLPTRELPQYSLRSGVMRAAFLAHKHPQASC